MYKKILTERQIELLPLIKLFSKEYYLVGGTAIALQLGHRQEGNPYTWPQTKEEIRQIFTPYTSSLNIKLLGTELDSTFKFMLPGLFFLIPKIMKKAWARRFGWSLWISGRKKG